VKTRAEMGDRTRGPLYALIEFAGSFVEPAMSIDKVLFRARLRENVDFFVFPKGCNAADVVPTLNPHENVGLTDLTRFGCSAHQLAEGSGAALEARGDVGPLGPVVGSVSVHSRAPDGAPVQEGNVHSLLAQVCAAPTDWFSASLLFMAQRLETSEEQAKDLYFQVSGAVRGRGEGGAEGQRGPGDLDPPRALAGRRRCPPPRAQVAPTLGGMASAALQPYKPSPLNIMRTRVGASFASIVGRGAAHVNGWALVCGHQGRDASPVDHLEWGVKVTRPVADDGTLTMAVGSRKPPSMCADDVLAEDRPDRITMELSVAQPLRDGLTITPGVAATFVGSSGAPALSLGVGWKWAFL